MNELSIKTTDLVGGFTKEYSNDQGKEHSFAVSNNQGETITLQYKTSQGWVDIPDTELVATDGSYIVALPSNNFRFSISDDDGSTELIVCYGKLVSLR